ncbi:MAG: hypothetical protein IJQ73_12745 [Kiritimatiellae bacterium]|nr:hypothetical protein [Kiritimatiellia bacterium]
MSTYPHLDTSMAIGDFHLDCTGRVKTATLCDFLQAAATAHAEILGVGMLDLMKHGITWMLAKMDISFGDWPASHEKLSLTTWPSGVRGRLICCRDYDMRDSQGRTVLKATSEWVCVNFETRKLARLVPSLLTLAPPDVPKVDVEPLPEMGEAVFTPAGESRIPVRRADLDVNRHVNNVHYIEWLFEPLTDAAYGRTLRHLAISYHAEALAGDEITSRVAEAALPDGSVATTHTLSRGETPLTKATCLWRE